MRLPTTIRKRRARLETLERRLLLTSATGIDGPADIQGWFASFEPSNRYQFAAAAHFASQRQPGSSVAALRTNFPSQWIVSLSDGAMAKLPSPAELPKYLGFSEPSTRVVRQLGQPNVLLLESYHPRESLIEKLSAHDYVSTFESLTRFQGQATPNDPHFARLESLQQINAPSAWDVFLQDAESIGSTSVVVGILDTGIDLTHRDLYLNIWLNQGEIPDTLAEQLVDADDDGRITFWDLNDASNEPFVFDQNQNGYIDAKDLLNDSRWANGFDDDTNSFIDDLVGWDFLNNDNDPSDDHRHGTHVAGTIAAIGNNDIDSVGVNWRSSLMSLKILDEKNQGSSPEAIAAVNYATMMRSQRNVNVRVTNNSFVGTEFSPAMQEAVARSADADILFVAAAGNGDIFGEGVDIDFNPRYPAAYEVDNIISVTATNIEGKDLASFANFGSCAALDDQGQIDCSVDIAAPGVGVVSTSPAMDRSSRLPEGNTTASRNGTSMAAPHVSGVAALIFAHDPEVTFREARESILISAQPLPHLRDRVAAGGILDARRALDALQDTPKAKLIRAESATIPGEESLLVTVQFESGIHQGGIDFTSIDDHDLDVRRLGFEGQRFPTQFVQACWVVGTNCIGLPPANAGVATTVVRASYRVLPPERYDVLNLPGTFDAIDNGQYEVTVNSGQVVDGVGVGNRSSRLSLPNELISFQVQIPDPHVLFVDTTDDGLPDLFEQHKAVTLRTALIVANAANAPVTIVVPPGTYTLDVAGANEEFAFTGDLDVRGDTTILGSGWESTRIDAKEIDRVFHVHREGRLRLHGMTLTGGASDTGAGIQNEGRLEVSLSTITGNLAVTGGGGIWNSQDLSVVESTLDQNEVTSPLGTGGGGIYNAGNLQVNRSTIANNLAAGGFLGDGGGGGVYSATTVEHLVEFVNSTISGNRATSGHGGGIHQSVGVVRMNHVTVTENTAVGLGGGVKLPEDPFAAVTGIGNSVIAGNSAFSDPDVSGLFVPIGANLVGIMRHSPTLNHQKWGTAQEPLDPMLGPLSDNTGPTMTHVPLPESPIVGVTQSSVPPIDEDQRRIPRPVGTREPRQITLGAVQKHFAEVRGRLFHDVDGNGEFGFGEKPLADWVVYVDVNHNGVLDANESSVITRADDPTTPAVDESEFVIARLDPSHVDVAVRTVPRVGFDESAPVVVITNERGEISESNRNPYTSVAEPTEPRIPIFHLDFSVPASDLHDLSPAEIPLEVGTAVSTIPDAGPRLENGRRLDAGRWAGAADDSNQILLFDHPTLDRVSRSAGSIVTWIKVDDQREWNGIVLTRCDDSALDKTDCDQFSRSRGLEFQTNHQSGVFGSVQGWTTNNFGPRHGTNGGAGGTETPSEVWTHVALTWNDVGDHTIYVNGIQGRTIDGVGPDPFGLNDPRHWSIGGDNVPLNSNFSTNDINRRRLRGELADFAIFDQELDGQSVNDIIRNGVPTPAKMRFHLDFSQSTRELADVSDQGLPIRVGHLIETIQGGGPALESGIVLDSGRWIDVADTANQIEILDHPALDEISRGSGTVATWVKVQNDADWNSIVRTTCSDPSDDCDPLGVDDGIELQTGGASIAGVSGSVRGSSQPSFGPQQKTDTNSDAAETPSGIWTHVALSWNDRGSQTIYVNGVPGRRELGNTESRPPSNPGSWVIGGGFRFDEPRIEGDENQGYLNGELADFVIFEGELDRRAVNDLVRFGVPRPIHPVFHLDFSAGDIRDASSEQLPIEVGSSVSRVERGGPNLASGLQLDAGEWTGANDATNQIRLLDHPTLDRVSQSAGSIVTWIQVQNDQAWNGIVKTACPDDARSCEVFGPDRGLELASNPSSGVFGAVQGWNTPAFGPSHFADGGPGGPETPSQRWTHVAMTWDNAGNQTIFVDGVPGQTRSQTDVFGLNDVGDWTIGGDGLNLAVPDGDGNHRRLTGRLADFAIFNVALGARELHTIATSGVQASANQNTVQRAVRSLASFDANPSIVGDRIVFEDHLGRLQLTQGNGGTAALIGLNTVSTEGRPFADGESVAYDGEFVAFTGRIDEPGIPRESPTSAVFVINEFGAFQELVNQDSPVPRAGTFDDKTFEVLSISNELVVFGVRSKDPRAALQSLRSSRGVNDQGIYAAIATGSAQVLVDTTVTVPGQDSTFKTFGDAVLDDTSFLAFQATYDGGFGIYQKRGIGPLDTAVDHTTALPEGGLLRSIESFALSNGELVFRGSSPNGQGIYLSNEQGMAVIANQQTPIPADVGTFQSFGQIAADKGNVVFIGRGRSAAQAAQLGLHEQVGIYVSLNGHIETVADLQPNSKPALFQDRVPVELSIGPQAISGNQVVFYAAFADGTDGIFSVEFDSHSRHDISLAPGAVISGLDFGRRARRGEISGQSYNDINRNGRRDPDEPGLPGWTIFLDDDGDGQLDPGEASTNTGETGQYRFTELPTLRNYSVKQLPQQNWVTSASIGSRHELFLDANQVVDGIDFGNRTTVQIDGQGGSGRIRVVVFDDQNGNGLRDREEGVALGNEVYLDVNNNGVFETGLDREPIIRDGIFEFDQLSMTSHEIRLRRSEGFEQTAPLGNSFDLVRQDNIGDRPTAVVAGRFDDDTHVDLIVGNNISNSLSLLSNAVTLNGGTRSTIQHGGIGPVAIAVEDLNADGQVDIAVANFHSSDVSVLLSHNQEFLPAAVYPIGENAAPVAITSANLNGDALPDLAVSNSAADSITLMINLGDGKFEVTHWTAGIGDKPQGIVAGRFNDDHLDDLAIVSQRDKTVRILLNQGEGTLLPQPEVTVGDRPSAIVAGDFDKDGSLDVAVANIGSSSVSVLFGDGSAALPRVQQIRVDAPPIALVDVDIDGDDDLDLVFTRSGEFPVSLLRNDGTGRFQSAAFSGATDFLDTSALPFSIATSDVNGDAEVDLILANRDSNSITILENKVISGSHRVSLRTNQPEQEVAFGIRPRNQPPEFQIATDQPLRITEDSGAHLIELVGISSGAFEQQALRFHIHSDNEPLIAASEVEIRHADATETATVTLSPRDNAEGLATITIELVDTGLDGVFDTPDDGWTSRSFDVHVLPVNDPPTLELRFADEVNPQAANPSEVELNSVQSAFRVDLLVSPGINEAQPIMIAAHSSDANVVPGFLRQSYDPQNSRGSVVYVVNSAEVGSATVTLTVEDGGLDLDLSTASDNSTVVRTFVVTVAKPPLPGDANLDGIVDLADYFILLVNFGRKNTVWDQGDFDRNGAVNFRDFLILSEHFDKRS